MAETVQGFVFGLVKDTLGWNAIFVTIGCLYIILLALTIVSSKLRSVNKNEGNHI